MFEQRINQSNESIHESNQNFNINIHNDSYSMNSQNVWRDAQSYRGDGASQYLPAVAIYEESDQRESCHKASSGGPFGLPNPFGGGESGMPQLPQLPGLPGLPGMGGGGDSSTGNSDQTTKDAMQLAETAAPIVAACL